MTISAPSIFSPSQKPLRIAVVQFSPKLGQVSRNIARARELCFKLEPCSIDLLCFSEMAFTGYVFDSADSILPYLEPPHTGPTSLFCKELASHLGCYVAAGYPERLESEELVQALKDMQENAMAQSTASTDTSSSSTVQNYVGANSAIIYSPSGDCVGSYRKTNLFEVDKTWAVPGTGFASFKLPLSSSSVLIHPIGSSTVLPTLDISLGICMDLNPQPPAEWTSLEGPYELADHCIKNQSKLLILLNAWLDPTVTDPNAPVNDQENSENKREANGDESDDNQPEWSTLNYWAARLMPLWKLNGRRRGSNETIYSDDSTRAMGSEIEDLGVDETVETEEEEEKIPHETIVIACNRTGKENGKTFAGSSAIFSMRAGSGRPKLLDMMGKREEGIRVWNIMI